MPGLFEDTVSAICYEVAASQETGAAPWDTPPFNDVTAFVLSQWRRMPRFLAWPLRFATLAFAFAGLTSGSLFHRLEPSRRRVQLESWRNSSLGPCRDLIRFYRSLATLALYSRAGTPE